MKTLSDLLKSVVTDLMKWLVDSRLGSIEAKLDKIDAKLDKTPESSEISAKLDLILAFLGITGGQVVTPEELAALSSKITGATEEVKAFDESIKGQQ